MSVKAFLITAYFSSRVSSLLVNGVSSPRARKASLTRVASSLIVAGMVKVLAFRAEVIGVLLCHSSTYGKFRSLDCSQTILLRCSVDE